MEGRQRKTRFIAEVSSNHHANLGRCLEFVDCAAEMGCDGIKFQLFRIRELYAPEVLAVSEEHRKRTAWELPSEFIEPIATRAKQRGIEFGCTPFYLAAVEDLRAHVDFLKIASYELGWDHLLSACAKTGRPIVLSTGMATLIEVDRAVDVLARSGCIDLTLLHCVSGYPTDPGDANLGAIGALRRLAQRVPGMSVAVGWSDHTVSPGVISRAIHRHAAEMIEFHLDLDGEGAEYAVGHCWRPEPMSAVISEIRVGLGADGGGAKVPARLEREERFWRADPVDGLRPLREFRASLAR